MPKEKLSRGANGPLYIDEKRHLEEPWPSGIGAPYVAGRLVGGWPRRIARPTGYLRIP